MSKKNLDRISIITTFYNAERFILQAVNSVNQQFIDGFELEYVIVDDKSPDKSRDMIEHFISVQGNGKIIWKVVEPEENLGCGGARKFGIDNSTGNYLMFLDADDYYMNRDFVLRAYNTIKKEKADIVEYGVIFNQQNGQQINNTVNQKLVFENPVIAEIALFKDNIIKFNVWTKIYTRDIVNTLPYSTARTYEDVRTIPVWVSNAKKIVVMPTPEINYRAASGSIIREDQIKTRVGTITAIAELFDNEFFNSNMQIMKAMYSRAMVDLEALLHNHSSKDAGFNEMSRLNTKMLKYIYPNQWEDLTFHIEDETKAVPATVELDQIDEDNVDLRTVKGWEE
jgi:glycosyltransferase involved in cell wall biosynthesis